MDRQLTAEGKAILGFLIDVAARDDLRGLLAEVLQTGQWAVEQTSPRRLPDEDAGAALAAKAQEPLEREVATSCRQRRLLLA